MILPTLLTSGPAAGLFFLDEHGCAKNQVDAEILTGILLSMGWKSVDDGSSADLVIVNSCGFIESAKTESLEAVINARAAAPRAKILLTGCLAQRYADTLATDLVEADAIFGNGDLSRLPEILTALFGPGGTSEPETSSGEAPREIGSRPILTPDQSGVSCGERPVLLNFPRSAYVKITEGCDNHCSYCAIPLIRGALRSRLPADIVDECRGLIDRGVWELNLIGQDLAAWGTGEGDEAVRRKATAILAGVSPLAALLKALSSLEGDFRLRLLYIHPDHFPEDILEVMTADSRFLPYFDIPFQSGSAQVLKAMNRRGSAERYVELVRRIRTSFADAGSPYGTVALRTTFLVGFPGETDACFADTARFLADVQCLWSGAFTWSPEEDTPALALKGRVPKKIARSRLEALQALQAEITVRQLAFFVDREIDVLVEEVIQGDSTVALGRAWFQAPEVDGSVVLSYTEGAVDRDGHPLQGGSLVRARVTAVNGVDLVAIHIP